MVNETLRVDKIDADFSDGKCELHLLRCDLFDLDIPGNKYWKMKYNLKEITNDFTCKIQKGYN